MYRSFKMIDNHLTRDDLLLLMNTIDFATDNQDQYDEYTIISGTSHLPELRNRLYNKYIQQGGK